MKHYFTKDDEDIVQKEATRFFSSIAESRSFVLELGLVAVAAALGINLISSFVGECLGSGWSLVLGLGLVIVPFSLLVFPRLKSVTFDHSVEGFLLYDKRSNELLRVPEYSLADEGVNYLSAAFVENEALRRHWDEYPLSAIFSDPDYPFRPAKKSIDLLQELLEYMVLEDLSGSLSEHFGAEPTKKGQLKVYGREDVPQVLLQNRFLELFSRKPEDRVLFLDSLDEDENVQASVVSSTTEQGAYYKNFTLILPKSSKLSRSESGGIDLVSPYLSLHLHSSFRGFNTGIPNLFAEHYMGISLGAADMQSYLTELHISIKVRRPILFNLRALKYSRWIEAFMDSVDERYSKEAFFTRIGWSQLSAAIRIFASRARHNTSGSGT